MTLTIEEHARQLVEDGFYQVSRKYRMVARLPAGLSGPAALEQADPETAQIFRKNYERQCEAHYLRVFAKPPNVVELDEATFEAFRRLGGKSAW